MKRPQTSNNERLTFIDARFLSAAPFSPCDTAERFDPTVFAEVGRVRDVAPMPRSTHGGPCPFTEAATALDREPDGAAPPVEVAKLSVTRGLK